MISSPCPRCGRPRPVDLRTPDRIRCPCGHDGPPSPQAAGALQEASAQLRQIAQRRRAGRGRRRKAIMSRIDSFSWMFNMMLVFVFVPASFSLMLPMLGDYGPVMSGVCYTPVCFLFPGLVIAFVWVKRSLRRRPGDAAQRAVNPENAGEPPRCALCGAAVAIPRGVVTITCEFCATQNIVDERSLAPQALDAALIAQHGAQLARAAHESDREKVPAALAIMLAGVLAYLFGSPLGCLVGALWQDLFP